MATEVQSGDLNGGSASRLEVSIDGLTLSPDSEGEADQADALGPHSCEHSTADPSDTSSRDDGEQDAENSVERIWGFPLVELYGLALRFFKGTKFKLKVNLYSRASLSETVQLELFSRRAS